MGRRRNARRAAATSLAICAAWPGVSHATNQTKGPVGTNHASAHVGPHASTGAAVKVGIIEAGGGVDLVNTRLDEDGRLIKNLDFTGLNPQIGAAPPSVYPAVGAPLVTDHATLVADVIGSSNADYTGVAPGARIYSAAVGGDNSIIAAIEYYNRVDQVGIFNMSLGGPSVVAADTAAHRAGVQILNAAGSLAEITTAADAFDFTGMTLPTQVDEIDIRFFADDGDSERGEIPPGGGPPPLNDFDFDNLELTLDTVDIPLKLNFLRNGVFDRGSYRFSLTPQQSTDLITALADNKLHAKVRRVADLNDTDSANNSGNRIEFNDAVGVNGTARLVLKQFNVNGNSQLSMALDELATTRDVLIVKSAGNTGLGSAQITDPGDFLNGITVGATDSSMVARARFSSYRLVGDTGANPDQGHKPEILAPGTSIDSATLIESGTSFAAPHVAGIAALIQKGTEQNAGLPLGTTVDNHLAVKAILLNSARKRFINGPENMQTTALDFPGTGGEASDENYLNADGTLRTDIGFRPKTGAWTPSQWEVTADGGNQPLLFTATRPLDDEQGVGLADAERALIQLDAGEQDPGSVRPIGWDRGVLGIAREASYSINEFLNPGDFITATLVWDRPVTVTESGGGASDGIFEASDVYSNGENIDFDLLLYFQGELLARSFTSDAIFTEERHTLEHLHFPVPVSGEINDYELRVNLGLGSGASYAVAWWTVPEPSAAVLMVIGLAGLVGRRRRQS